MSSSIRFTNSARRQSKHSSQKHPPLVLNGTPVQKVSGSALRSSPVKRPTRVTTHLTLSPPPTTLETPVAPSHQTQKLTPSSPSSPSSPVSSASLSPASSSSSSASSSASSSPARRPRNMIPVPEIPIPDWNHHLDPNHPFDPDSPTSTPPTTPSDADDHQPPPSSPQPPQTFFIHNGYRYDGDVFELRPPQERSIASRPERILEHKPALLPHRQQFNRVYSEGTYNARPSSLRQMANRSSSRFSTELLKLQPSETPHLDLPGCEPLPLPVTRPPSIRPSSDVRPLHTRNQPDSPTSAESFCQSIHRARLEASITGDTKLQGLLAYSAVPVTRIAGDPPAPHITKAHCVVAPHTTLETSSSASLDENRYPGAREKRGRSYTSFANSTPYVKTKPKEKERRPSIWKMFTR